MKETSHQLLSRILDYLGVDNYDIEIIESDDEFRLNIDDISDRDTALLIGRQGDTLHSLQYILRSLVREKMDLINREEKQIIIDIANYRRRQLDHLTILAKRKAQEAKETGKDIVLRPMNPFERRIVHLALKDDSFIETISQGTEPERYIIIKVVQQTIDI